MVKRSPASRGGFTLLEILVALVLIGLLVGTLLPAVLNQLSRGEVNRIGEDLQAVAQAAKTFRIDVQRWPGDLEDLYSTPLTTSPDATVTGALFPVQLASRWAGPYVEEGIIKGDSLPTASGGVILNWFSQTSWGGKNFLTIKVKGITSADAQALSLQLDGDTLVNAGSATTAPNDALGQVRWRSGGDGGVDTLIYLSAPVQ